MATRLDPTGDVVYLDNEVIVRTPGLEGIASVVLPTSENLRAEGNWSDVLERSILAEGMVPQLVVQIDDPVEVPEMAAITRSTSYGDDVWELTVPAPNNGWGQLVLSSDESGVTTWAFARDTQRAVNAQRGTDTRTYVLPRRVARVEGGPRHRGLLSTAGRKILSVIAFKLIDPMFGAIGEYYARRWEEKKRPYRLRSFTPDDFNQPEGMPIDESFMRTRVGSNRALLMVHGTFSRTHTAFGAMPRAFVEKLSRVYEGRIFAFDHFTLSHSPQQNVEWLLERIPPDVRLNLDMICHSRGGLVCRTLAEKHDEQSSTNRPVDVRRVVFVGTPNGGTVLADSKHIGTFIDTYTNLLSIMPENGVTEALEGVITVAKILATGILKGLEGIRAMDPQAEFLTWLNSATPLGGHYYAIASDYEPTHAGWRDWTKNRIMDAIFRSPNDLVVPTRGVFEANGSPRFPIADRLEYTQSDGVSHSGFFGEPRTCQQVLKWLE